MPATLSSITSKKATLYVPLDEDDPDGEKVKVVYKPKAYDRRFERDLNRISQDKGEDEAIAAAITTKAFLNIVVSWDLQADAGDAEPIPLTEEGLETVPVVVLSGILKAIGDDQRPDPKAENGSPKRS